MKADLHDGMSHATGRLMTPRRHTLLLLLKKNNGKKHAASIVYREPLGGTRLAETLTGDLQHCIEKTKPGLRVT